MLAPVPGPWLSPFGRLWRTCDAHVCPYPLPLAGSHGDPEPDSKSHANAYPYAGADGNANAQPYTHRDTYARHWGRAGRGLVAP